RLNPYHPERFWHHLGRAHYTARRYPEAAQALSRLTWMDHMQHALFAATLAQLGDSTGAAARAEELRKQDPAFSIERCITTLHYELDSDREHFRQGLLKAGLPA